MRYQASRRRAFDDDSRGPGSPLWREVCAARQRATGSTRYSFFGALALLCCTTGPALADGFVEGVAGIAIPLSDDDYADAVDEGLKLGVRGGSGNGPTAFELTLDYTAFGGFEVLGVDFDYTRYRALVGGRHRIPVGRTGTATLVVRGGVGVDVMGVTATNDAFNIDETETDAGIAGEVGLGLLISAGNLYLGGHVAVPMAFHFDEDDPDDPEDVDAEYTGIDLDLLFTVGARI